MVESTSLLTRQGLKALDGSNPSVSATTIFNINSDMENWRVVETIGRIRTGVGSGEEHPSPVEEGLPVGRIGKTVGFPDVLSVRLRQEN